MIATSLLARLRAVGAVLSIHGDRLRYSAPAGAIPSALRLEAGERRAELIEELRREQQEDSSPCVFIEVLAGDGRTVNVPLEQWLGWLGVKPASPAPTPPPGVRLYLQNANGQPCGPAETFLWTWEGGRGGWHYASEHALPPYVLAVGPYYRRRCVNGCGRRAYTLTEQVNKADVKQLKAACATCGAHVAFLPHKSLDLEYHTA